MGTVTEDRSVCGRWGAVTALTPMRRYRTPLLRGVFRFGNTTSVAVRPILTTRVIALARWTLIPDRRRPSHLLFETNWSGADQTYIPELARMMWFQWHSIWDHTTDFPGPLPTTRLLDWVDDVDLGADHYWTDYDDDATTQTVLQALQLRERIARFLGATSSVAPAAFARHFTELLVDIQRLL